MKATKRLRVLCVGRAGVGKSSLINRVFSVKEAVVSDWKPGHADIEQEFTCSAGNQAFLLHDSEGFEPGDTKTFDIVSRFVLQRRNSSVSHKDRLHAVWLCAEMPRAGGRIFEAGDEKLLKLAYETQTPLVVVFTKYDLLVRTKWAELHEDQAGRYSEDLDKRSKQEAEKALHTCVKFLERTVKGMNIQMPRYVTVSTHPDYETGISPLVEVTCNSSS